MEEKIILLERIEKMGLRLETIKLMCPKCGNSWGIRLSDYPSLADIPNKKFYCLNCD